MIAPAAPAAPVPLQWLVWLVCAVVHFGLYLELPGLGCVFRKGIHDKLKVVPLSKESESHLNLPMVTFLPGKTCQETVHKGFLKTPVKLIDTGMNKRLTVS